ncbi:MAG: hypothetical protein KC620_18815 [Myxococcales bacterium]|nr:hypothetical protein [Myxococcales bacterium]
MSEATRLRFAGGLARLGFVALALFALFGALGAAGLLMGLMGGLFSVVGGLGALGLAAATALIVVYLIRGGRRFATLVVEPDGTWRLLGLFGGEKLRLAPDAMRAVDVRHDKAMFITGVVNVVRRSWVEIELPDGRVFASLKNAEPAQAAALEALHRLTGGRA